MSADIASTLVRDLGAYDPLSRERASEGLVKLGEGAVPTVVDGGLRSLDPAVRWYAAQVLGQIGSTEAVMPLCIALADSDPDVVQEAIRALTRIGDEEAVPLLEAFSSNPAHEDYLCDEAREAIDEIRSGDKQRLFGKAAELGKQGKVEDLASLIQSTSDHDARARAVEELGTTADPEAVRVLIAAHENDANLTGAVRRALVDLGPNAVEPLIGQLKSELFQTRLLAAMALEAIGDGHAIAALDEVSKTDSDEFVRRAAATAVEKLRA